MKTIDEFDPGEELDRLLGRTEYFEADKELRTLVSVKILLLILALLIFIHAFTAYHIGCTLGGLVTYCAFAILLVLYIRLMPSFINELEDENEFEEEVFFSINKKRALWGEILTLGLSSLLCMAVFIRGILEIIYNVAPFFTYLSLIFSISTSIMFILALKMIMSHELFDEE